MDRKKRLKRALMLARMHNRHEVEQLLSETLYRVASPEIIEMARELSKKCHGLGISGALSLLAAIGWELAEEQ